MIIYFAILYISDSYFTKQNVYSNRILYETMHPTLK